MNKKDFAFGKTNYIICAVAVCMIILGFCLMLGPASSIETGFEADIFSTRRISVAPITCFFGFLLMIVGILYPAKKETELNDDSVKA